MRKLALLIGVAALAAGLGAGSSWAVNSSTTIFVDPENGNDNGGTCGGQVNVGSPSNPPCATLNAALAIVAAGGQIVIESGGTFGPIYITQAVSIQGPADQSVSIVWSNTQPGCTGAAVGSCNGSAPATYAVDINAGSANTVKLRNLVINNGGGSNGAVHIGNNFGVALKDVNVRGGSGTIPQMVYANPSALTNTGGPVQLYFSGCDIAFSSSGGGVYVEPTVSVSALFQGGEVHNGAFGVKFDASVLPAGSSITAAVDNTEFFSFNNSAVTAKSVASAGAVHLLLARSSIVNTGSSAFNITGPASTGILFEDAITGNLVGVNVGGGGSAFGFANSEIFGNSTNVTGTITEQPLQ